MPVDGLTSQPTVNHSLRAPGIITAWPRLTVSEAADWLGESRRRFLDGGRVEPDGRNGRGAKTTDGWKPKQVERGGGSDG